MHRDHQVFVQEFDRIRDARADAANMSGKVEDEIDRVVGKELMGCRLIAQIELLRRRRQNALVAVPTQTLHERPADHAAPTGDKYARRFFHVDPGL
jgi:hypothetical protein